MVESDKTHLQAGQNADAFYIKDPAQIRNSAMTVVRRMAIILASKNNRSSFFSTLSEEIGYLYPFDRLSINLYDSESEVLCFFTAAEGTVVSALSSLREANQNTVAGKVINTRKPVVISNLLAQFHGKLAQPMTDAGLNCTIAFPLIENNNVIGTLHCSFAEEPTYFIEIIDFFAELVPFVTIFLSHVLTKERLQSSKIIPPLAHLPGAATTKDIVLFDSEAMRKVMATINSVAPLNIPVLITGETGTGKTLLAKYIHENSPRASRNFVKVNCPSIVPSLMESELFGHIRGAFTGANVSRIGRVELSQSGTLFLDEVAELPLEMQSKFLQVVEEKAFERVGESSQTSVDFRLISATNQDIPKAIANSKLRQDFYYRLAAVSIVVPPLRNRTEDIPILFEFMANSQAKTMGVPALTLPSKLMNELKAYSWPGNIREMRNVINRLLVQTTNKKINLEILREALADNSIQLVSAHQQHLGSPKAPFGNAGETNCEDRTMTVKQRLEDTNKNYLDIFNPSSVDTLEDMERKYISQVVQSCRGIISGTDGAAAKLGIPRTTLQHKMRKLGIQKIY